MDIRYLLALQQFREGAGAFLAPIVNIITHLGGGTIIAVMIGVFYWCINKECGQYLLFTTGIGNFMNNLAKLCCCVYRPWVRDSRIKPYEPALHGATGYSFPSGHATGGTAYLMELGDRYRKKNAAIPLITVIVLVLVMFSRNFLGVHTPQDVLVGLCMGLLSLFLAHKMLRWADGGENRDFVICAVSFVVAVAAIVFVAKKGYPMDYDANGTLIVDPENMKPDFYMSAGGFCGLTLGWSMERHYLNFTIPEKLSQKAAVLGIGFAALVVWTKVLIPLAEKVIGAMLANVLGFGLLYFVVTFVYPYIFTRIIEKKG